MTVCVAITLMPLGYPGPFETAAPFLRFSSVRSFSNWRPL